MPVKVPPRRSSTIENIKWRVLAGEDPSEMDSSTFQELIQSLREDGSTLAISGNDKESEAIFRKIERLKSAKSHSMKEGTQKTLENQIRNRLQTAENDLEKLRQSILTQELSLKARFEENMSNLRQKHEKELKDLHEEWNRPQKKRKYSRNSPKLINLRAQAEKLLSTHRFIEMREVESIAESLQHRETEEMQAKMVADFQLAVKQMQIRQAEEIEVVRMENETKLLELERAKQADVSASEKRIQNLKTELESCNDTEKVWNLHGRNETKSVTLRPKSARQAKKNESVRVKSSKPLSIPDLPDLPETNAHLDYERVVNIERTSKSR